MSDRVSLSPIETAFAEECRAGRLATASASGRPRAVPVCYAFDGSGAGGAARFFIALDEKPKTVAQPALGRVRDILARGEAALLIDRYEDDWSRLGYLLVHARAEIAEPESAAHAAGLPLLRARYPQYRAMALERAPLILLTATRITAWGPALATELDAAPVSEWLRAGRGVDFPPLARGRRSVRAFQQREVPRAALEEMLEAARWAPSPHGRQPWRFVVLTRPELKERLAAAMGDDWRGVLAQDGQSEETVTLRLAKSRARIREAPALILACLYLDDLDAYPDPQRQRAEEVMAIQSLGAAVQNMLLAAYAIGLDTGWMCAPLFSPDAARVALGLDASLIPHALIPVGYVARDPKRRPHRPVSDLVARWD
ncbi:MAG TPA: TIGR03668 family PPOX class F420-dependent oxidoreductase [Ktedonobacterales bacterium]|nr:TIGR03668 family PPOX class F420-dependent oxidoreductase [Ktedonobacterales bacterium]